jgi:hypothetical protein
MTFRERYSFVRGVPLEQFEHDLFVRCVVPRWRWIAPLLLKLIPNRFWYDLKLIRTAGNASGLPEINECAINLRHDPREPGNFVRDVIGIRVSGRLLMQEAEQVWADNS